MSVSAPRPEIATLTGVRAYAAVWVMLLHLPFSLGVMPHVRLPAVLDHGAWGVDVFFVLSGFLLSLLYVPRFQSGDFPRRYWNYLAARFARIYPLHVLGLAALGAWYGAHLLAGGAALPNFGKHDFALNALLLHAWGYSDRLNWNYPSWSISAEWFAYLVLTPALALGLQRARTAAAVAIAFSGWALLCWSSWRMDLPIFKMAPTSAVPRLSAEFVLGSAGYRMLREVRMKPRAADGLALGAIAALIGLTLLPPHGEWLLGPVVMALVLGLAGSGPVSHVMFGNRIAVFWGERSYSIYMLHGVVQIFSNLLLQRLGMTTLPAPAAYALFAAIVAAVLACAHLVYQYLELPARRLLRERLELGATVTVAAVGRAAA